MDPPTTAAATETTTSSSSKRQLERDTEEIIDSQTKRLKQQQQQLLTSPPTTTTTRTKRLKQRATQQQPLKLLNTKVTDKFVFFYGSRAVFSQFHPATFVLDGQRYGCAEQYMQHQKAVRFEDDDTAERILRTPYPSKQKSLGRRVVNFKEAVWSAESIDVVKRGSRAKYSQNSEMKRQLFDTYPRVLVESSPTDKLWGIGLSYNDPKAEDPSKWRGRNLLGMCLTDVRNQLMEEEGLLSSSTDVDTSSDVEKKTINEK